MRYTIRYSVLAIFLPAVMSCSTITNIFFSDENEIAIGEKMKAQILADPAHYPQYHGSADVITYVNALGMQIANAQTARTNIPYSFTIIDDTIINAFSLPGGPVFIYKGLLKAAKSGAEVACVLAHEVGHITQRHAAQHLVQQYGVDFLNQIVFGSDSSVAATIGTMLEGMLFLKFSRDDEYQADSCGVVYGRAAGYNPYGLKNFFTTLYSLYRDTPFEAFSDHPKTSDRIANAQRLITNLPAPAVPTDTTGLHIAEYTTLKSQI